MTLSLPASRAICDAATPIRNRFIDLTGRIFDRLTILAYSEKRGRHHFWRCQCACGTVCVANGEDIRKRHTKSCGCMKREGSMLAHGKHRTREYAIWLQMRQRCTSPRCRTYRNYGARGIRVCARWDDFANFLADMGPRPSSRHSIDRRNNDGNYEPGNCRWTTVDAQQSNKRTNRWVTAFGTTLTVTQWAKRLGVSRSVITHRLNRGIAPEVALRAA